MLRGGDVVVCAVLVEHGRVLAREPRVRDDEREHARVVRQTLALALGVEPLLLLDLGELQLPLALGHGRDAEHHRRGRVLLRGHEL